MGMTSFEIDLTADRLIEAEQSRSQMGLLSKQFRGMTLQDAYAIQAALVERKLAAGRAIIGWKIGLTSKTMQNALNISTPDSGVLFDDMLFAHSSSIPDSRFIQARIEAEIAFVLKAPLQGFNVSRTDVLSATEYVAPALEILDTRILRADPDTGELRKVFDTVADNAANAGLVLGKERHDPAQFDLRWTGAIVHKNNEVEETGLGAGVLNDPVSGIIWLLERLTECDQSLRAGDIVLSGSFIRPIEARSGDSFFADFGNFGSVRCSFA